MIKGTEKDAFALATPQALSSPLKGLQERLTAIKG